MFSRILAAGKQKLKTGRCNAGEDEHKKILPIKRAWDASREK